MTCLNRIEESGDDGKLIGELMSYVDGNIKGGLTKILRQNKVMDIIIISIRKIWLILIHKTNIDLENKQKSAKKMSIFDICLF